MGNRRGFLSVLGAVSSAGLTLRAGAQTNAQSAVAATPVPAGKTPSAAALATATAFRAFDARLSDAEITIIARNIDDNRTASATLNPKAKPLDNSNDLVVRFSASENV